MPMTPTDTPSDRARKAAADLMRSIPLGGLVGSAEVEEGGNDSHWFVQAFATFERETPGFARSLKAMRPKGPPMTQDDVERIGLTTAQRAVVLSLPADGSFGPADTHKTARYMWYGIGPRRETRLVEHQHCTNNSWCLNRRGRLVRAHLERQAHD